MRILAFPASNSKASINSDLVQYALGRLGKLTQHLDTNVLSLNDFEMPLYSIDRETEEGIPNSAHHFFKQIGSADVILVSFAEHNGCVSVAWKNIFDWMSRIQTKVWQGKPLVLLAATPGPRAGGSVLAQQVALAPHFGADVKGYLGIGNWSESWDPGNKQLLKDNDINRLDELLSTLLPTTRN
ncbi:MAG: NAD(P)H-dependent oxidoreductase [Pseudomonadota bacterium]